MDQRKNRHKPRWAQPDLEAEIRELERRLAALRGTKEPLSFSRTSKTHGHTMPSNDAARVDRVTQALGAELFAGVIETFTAIGHDIRSDLSPLDGAARKLCESGIGPEDMLIAFRILSRSLFLAGTTEADRVEMKWHSSVRQLMNAYYDPATRCD